jgi:hypothetical protein
VSETQCPVNVDLRRSTDRRPMSASGSKAEGVLPVADFRFGEGFRMPAPFGRWCGIGGRRPKASQGGNRGEVGGPFGERAYGELWIADGWRARRRRPGALGAFVGSGGVGRFRWRRWAGARRWPRSQEDWRPRTGVALVFRRAAGGGGDRRCGAGCGATVMSCRSRSGSATGNAKGAALRTFRR